MLTATLTIPGDRFSRIRGGLTDQSGPLEAVGHWVVNKWMPALFRSGGQGEWPSPLRGGSALRDTGTLSKAFSWSLGLDRRSVLVINPMKYAAMQNFGGTVTAKNAYKGVPGGPYLAIPLPTLTKAQRRAGPSAFKDKDTFIAKSRNGNMIVFEKLKTKEGKQKRRKSKFASRWRPGQTAQVKEAAIKPLFVLRTSVTIKPRPFMKWFPEMKAQATAIAKATILKAMGEKAA